MVRRYSRQREAILHNLQNRTDHPSAEAVYQSLRQTLPSISLGTVYRNLNALSGDGLVLRFSVGGKEHFDGNAAPHLHFICTRCGRIDDWFDDSATAALHKLAQQRGCTLTHTRLLLFGECSVCQAQK